MQYWFALLFSVYNTLCILVGQFDRDAENYGLEATTADKSVLYFNQALIHMRLHQYKHATILLEQLNCAQDSLHSKLIAISGNSGARKKSERVSIESANFLVPLLFPNFNTNPFERSQ